MTEEIARNLNPGSYVPEPWFRGNISQKHCVATPSSQNLARTYAGEYFALCLARSVYCSRDNYRALTLYSSHWVVAVPFVIFFPGPRSMEKYSSCLRLVQIHSLFLSIRYCRKLPVNYRKSFRGDSDMG